MKIVIALDSFKESLSAAEACQAVAAGIARVMPDAELICCPMADGGEGTATVMRQLLGGERIVCQAENALGEIITACYTLLPDKTAVIEMAAAAGLDLIPPAMRNPLVASTYGVGQLMLDALQHGASSFIIGLGGSATNDGGAGMLQALGVKLLDKNGGSIARDGLALQHLAKIDCSAMDSRWQNTRITIASDVNNPLCGSCGASAVFGGQKGADSVVIAQLDSALAHFAAICAQNGLPPHRDSQGAGAAGGLGFALLTFFTSEVQSGIDIVMAAADLQDKLQHADLVITGEGRMDGQTGGGKVPHGVLQAAKQANVPCVVLCGSLGEDLSAIREQGYHAVLPAILRVDSLENTLLSAKSSVEYIAEQIAALLLTKNVR